MRDTSSLCTLCVHSSTVSLTRVPRGCFHLGEFAYVCFSQKLVGMVETKRLRHVYKLSELRSMLGMICFYTGLPKIRVVLVEGGVMHFFVVKWSDGLHAIK